MCCVLKTAGKCRRKNHVPKEKFGDCGGITKSGFKTAKWVCQKWPPGASSEGGGEGVERGGEMASLYGRCHWPTV